MMQEPSNWPPWLRLWRESQESVKLGERVTRLEVHQERQDEINQQHQDRMVWLERGMQALAVLVVAVITKSAPSSAGAVAELLLGMLKR